MKSFLWSPFIVPLGAFAVPMVWIAVTTWGQAYARRLRSEQRMAMIARGLPVGDIERLMAVDREPRRAGDPLLRLGNARRIGIFLISLGIGLMICFGALAAIHWKWGLMTACALGLIPLAVGIGFLIDYHLQKRDLSRLTLEAGAVFPPEGGGVS